MNAAVLALGATLDPTGNFCIPKDVFETSKEADGTGAAHPASNGFPSSSPRLKTALFETPLYSLTLTLPPTKQDLTFSAHQ